MNGQKEGLATKDEIKVLWGIVNAEIPIPAIIKPITTLVVPGILDGIDNKIGDKLPEPWQSHCEKLVTLTVDAVEDKVITEEEVEEVVTHAAEVLDTKVDIPLIGDDVEAVLFLETFRMLGALLYSAFHKKKLELASFKGDDSGEPDGPDMG